MAINEWWAGSPWERYWLEITDRAKLGANLIAPKKAANGKETPSYTLVRYVQPGDVVFHWWKRPGQEPAIVGSSTVAGQAETSELTWQAHGTRGRSRSGPTTSPAWEAPLTDFEELEDPVTLGVLRDYEGQLRAIRDEIKSRAKGPIYFPYAFSEKRPLRTAQGYLLKFPAAIVETLPELHAARATVPRPKPEEKRAPRRGTKRIARQQDPVVRKAIERHAVEWTLKHFGELGYSVEDVGDTESFDVFALGPDGDELHIEVKGSATDAAVIELTDGEAKHWSPEYERVLVVVDMIDWVRTAARSVQTRGGRTRIWRSWELDEAFLEPTRYRYTLPEHEGPD